MREVRRREGSAAEEAGQCRCCRCAFIAIYGESCFLLAFWPCWNWHTCFTPPGRSGSTAAADLKRPAANACFLSRHLNHILCLQPPPPPPEVHDRYHCLSLTLPSLYPSFAAAAATAELERLKSQLAEAEAALKAAQAQLEEAAARDAESQRKLAAAAADAAARDKDAAALAEAKRRADEAAAAADAAAAAAAAAAKDAEAQLAAAKAAAGARPVLRLQVYFIGRCTQF